MIECEPNGHTVNQKCYIEALVDLRERDRKKKLIDFAPKQCACLECPVFEKIGC